MKNNTLLFVVLIIGFVLAIGLFDSQQTNTSTVLFSKHQKTQKQEVFQEKQQQQEEQNFSLDLSNFMPIHDKQAEITEEIIKDFTEFVFTKEEIEEMKRGRHLKDLKHECHHDKKWENEWQDHHQNLEKKYLLDLETNIIERATHEVSSDWQPFRFHVNFENIASNIPSAQQDFIKNKMIPAAKAYFQSTFLVKRLSSPIIPSTYYTQRGYKCNNEVPIPKSLYKGVSGADMVMLITAGFDKGENYLAYASNCYQAEQALSSGRPTIGFFRINASFLEENMNASRWFVWIETAIHEMMHAMGFSSAQFKNFLNGGGRTATSNGQSFFMGPNAVAFGQEYFGCTRNNGLPLENNGGSGSAGSHWERVTFGNEGMTASDFGDAVYSKFTLNLFRDSGWYEFNEEMAQELAWSKGGGCTAMGGGCNTSQEQHSCSSGQKGCNFDYTGGGYCTNQSTFAPNCPYYQGYSNALCQTGDFMVGISGQAGGIVGKDSRCLNVKGNSYGYACFESKCVDGQISVKVDGSWQDCEEGDTIRGRKVTVICPPNDDFCGVESNCENSCTAQGTCINGTCECYQGYSGESCNLRKKEQQTDQTNTSGTTTNTSGSSGSSSNTSTSGSGSSSGIVKYSGTAYCSKYDYLVNYQNSYYCCDDELQNCCPIYSFYSTAYRGCVCITGHYYNSYTGQCQ